MTYVKNDSLYGKKWPTILGKIYLDLVNSSPKLHNNKTDMVRCSNSHCSILESWHAEKVKQKKVKLTGPLGTALSFIIEARSARKGVTDAGIPKWHRNEAQ